MKKRFLEGITRPSRQGAEFKNPPLHSPLGIQNVAHLEVVGPDEHGRPITKQKIEAHGNILVTYGLSRLVALLAGGSMNASDWIGGMRIGTDSTAAGFSDSRLGASTQSVDLTDAGDVIEAGARTLRCVATFASDGNSGSIREIGVYASSNVTTGLVNRIVLTGTQSVNRGASDSINVSMDFVFVSG